LTSFSLFSKLWTPLFIACKQSEFQRKSMLEMRRNFESKLCSRNTMYKRDVYVRLWNSVMSRTFDVKVMLPNAWRGKQQKISTRTWSLLEIKTPKREGS
jgi:hypothetical protein